MVIVYKNKTLERLLILANTIVTVVVILAALAQLGFYQPILPHSTLLIILTASVAMFVTEKITRFFNSLSKKDFFKTRWYEILFVTSLVVLFIYAGAVIAMSVYLLLQIITKICRSLVNLAASGRNPARALIGSFLILIICGTVLLMLPRSYTLAPVSFVDALFTATSASCVTGLVVKDTGTDFTLVGQTVIVVLIQLGGLGIVIFGAVFALMLGQALSVRQSVAMQNLLNAQTMGRISNLIAFIFVVTMIIEALGAVALFNMWEKTQKLPPHIQHKWFCSIFHSISAFCNAGFGLFSDSLTSYKNDWRINSIIAPLIILGGLGFGVIYNLANVISDRIKNALTVKTKKNLHKAPAVGLRLQTKIVLSTSLILIVAGAVLLLISQKNTSHQSINLSDAFFQSISARTAGFNSIDIKALSGLSKSVLMILMFIGGSPGSTAGGIKTVTLVVIIMAVYATIRKRSEVEVFKRSIPMVTVGKALTIILLFAVVLLSATFLLSITERKNNFDESDIVFEVSSALGTVGLSCGITGQLSTPGKIIIIITMLIGRLGPLTMLALLTFNITPAKFNYPTEAVVVG